MMRYLQCLTGVMGVLFFTTDVLLAVDKIYMKGSSTPTEGAILKVEDASVRVQLGGVGETALQIANIERVEVSPRPATLPAGLKAAGEHKVQDAIKTLEPIYTQYRGLPEAWIEECSARLGEAYVAAQDWAKARELFVRFQKAYPQSELRDSIQSGMAQALFGLKQPEEALKLLEPLVAGLEKEATISDEQNRAIGRACVTLGHCYKAAQKDDQALDAFLKTTVLYYLDGNAVAEAQYESALLFEKMNNLARARGQLEDLLKESPGSAFAAEAKKKLDSLPSEGAKL
ncbi:MAG: tetratricopeptide repeat protein [Verrucomicrobia bacterium]|nr:tetratricopeptide repeat protein [Verrucomicrobiota bacterium]